MSAFVVSRYASTVTRAQRKPFNPLEGETYENYREDLGWWFVAEQVIQNRQSTTEYGVVQDKYHMYNNYKTFLQNVCNTYICHINIYKV